MKPDSLIFAEALRTYRGLMFLYPAEFRGEYARELCLAFDSEREGNRQLRPGCWEDCREHQQMTA